MSTADLRRRAPAGAAPSADGRRPAASPRCRASGLRVEVPLATRTGGAGPGRRRDALRRGRRDHGADRARRTSRDSPYVLRGEDDGGWGVYRDGDRLASASARARGRATTTSRPPTASRTGRSRCCTWTRWPARCCRPAPTGATTTSARFCGIGVTLAAGPHDRQEDPGDARRGGRRRPGPRRRGRRDADHRQHRHPRPGRHVRRRAAARRSRRPPGCRCRCSSSRRPTST